MTASEFASLLHAKRAGKGKWIAKCPSHPDRHPSLSIAEGKRQPVVFRCMSHGCSQTDILAAMGLAWADVIGGTLSPEAKARLAEEAKLRRLERRHGLAMFAAVLIPERRNYWRKAEDNLRREIMELTFRLHPERKRAYDLQLRIRREGFDALWESLLPERDSVRKPHQEVD